MSAAVAVWVNIIGMPVDQVNAGNPGMTAQAPAPMPNQLGQAQLQQRQLPQIIQPQQPEAANLTDNTGMKLQEGINYAISMVRPAVVSIITAQKSPMAADQNGLAFIQPFDAGKGETGTGIIIHPQGYVLTTYQTIGNAREVHVHTFSGGKKQFTADVLTVDPNTDLALLKIRSTDQFPAAMLGNSDAIEIGDIVFAVGSPYGFSRTVTMGIVSTSRRTLEINGIKYPDMIQTDSAINPGDDGGPLINIKGEVIGVSIAYFIPGSHFTGIGFAVPINDAGALIGKIGR